MGHQFLESHPAHEAPLSLVEQQNRLMQEILDPRTPSALINIDLQRDLISPDGKAAMLWGQDVLSAQAILPQIEKVTEAFRQRGKPVIFTKVYENIEGRNMARMARALFHEKIATPEDEEFGVACVRGTRGADLIVPVHEGELVIEKTLESAWTPELRDYLKSKGVKVVFLAGVRSQRCVLATLKDMYNNIEGAYVSVLEDCIATNDPGRHMKVLEEMQEFYPPVITSEQLLSSWNKDASQGEN
jgi:nicotinamidase-related amidase